MLMITFFPLFLLLLLGLSEGDGRLLQQLDALQPTVYDYRRQNGPTTGNRFLDFNFNLNLDLHHDFTHQNLTSFNN